MNDTHSLVVVFHLIHFFSRSVFEYFDVNFRQIIIDVELCENVRLEKMAAIMLLRVESERGEQARSSFDVNDFSR